MTFILKILYIRGHKFFSQKLTIMCPLKYKISDINIEEDIDLQNQPQRDSAE